MLQLLRHTPDGTTYTMITLRENADTRLEWSVQDGGTLTHTFQLRDWTQYQPRLGDILRYTPAPEPAESEASVLDLYLTETPQSEYDPATHARRVTLTAKDATHLLDRHLTFLSLIKRECSFHLFDYPDKHLQTWRASAALVFPNEEIKITIDTEVWNADHTTLLRGSVPAEPRLVQYDGLTLRAALDAIAAAYETEWWIEPIYYNPNLAATTAQQQGRSGRIHIHLGHCEDADSAAPLLSLQEGITCQQIQREKAQKPRITRLYAYGSRDNLPTRYGQRPKSLVVRKAGPAIYRLLSNEYYYYQVQSETLILGGEGLPQEWLSPRFPLLDNAVTDALGGSRYYFPWRAPDGRIMRSGRSIGGEISVQDSAPTCLLGTFRDAGGDIITVGDIVYKDVPLALNPVYMHREVTARQRAASIPVMYRDGDENPFQPIDPDNPSGGGSDPTTPGGGVKALPQEGGFYSDIYPETKPTGGDPYKPVQLVFQEHFTWMPAAPPEPNPDHTPAAVHIPHRASHVVGATLTLRLAQQVYNADAKRYEWQPHGDAFDTFRMPISELEDDLYTDPHALGDRRLHIPAANPTPYVQAPDAPTTPAEQSEALQLFEDVRPSFTFTVGSFATTTRKDQEQDDDGTMHEKTRTLYNINLPAHISITPQMLTPTTGQSSGKPLRIHFNTGALAGKEFDAALNPAGGDYYRLGACIAYYDPESSQQAADRYHVNARILQRTSQVLQIVPNEDYGYPLPSPDFTIQAGDQYTLIGVDATLFFGSGAVEEAERTLLARATEHIKRAALDGTTYTATLRPAAFLSIAQPAGTTSPAAAYLSQLQPSTAAAYLTDSTGLALIDPRDRPLPIVATQLRALRIGAVCTIPVYRDGYTDDIIRHQRYRILSTAVNLAQPYREPQITLGLSSRYSRLTNIEHRLNEKTK